MKAYRQLGATGMRWHTVVYARQVFLPVDRRYAALEDEEMSPKAVAGGALALRRGGSHMGREQQGEQTSSMTKLTETTSSRYKMSAVSHGRSPAQKSRRNRRRRLPRASPAMPVLFTLSYNEGALFAVFPPAATTYGFCSPVDNIRR